MSVCGLCTPGEEKLLDHCYPSSKLLADPSQLSDLKPSSNELGRLSFQCTNKSPTTLSRVSEALERKKVGRHAKYAHKHPKSKAIVILSLDILKRLLEDCGKSKLQAAAQPAMNMLKSALTVPDTSGEAAGYSASGGSWDLQVVEHAASAFATLAAFADASWLGVDPALSQSYLDILSTWANIGVQPFHKNAANAADLRMLGLYALSASFTADAFENTDTDQPISVALPCLLENLSQPSASIPVLNDELERSQEQSKDGSVREKTAASKRVPLEKRRPRSFRKEHHGEAEKEIQNHAVIGQALLVLRQLIQRCRARQLEHVLLSTLDWLDAGDQQQQRWTNVEWCCWLAQTVTQLAHIQYRFVVVKSLLDALITSEQARDPSTKQTALLAMITSVLSGPTSLLGLGLGDVLSSLVSLIARRAPYGPQDTFLPAIIDGTASLATRVYYLDQISDLVQDLIVALRRLPPPSTSSSFSSADVEASSTAAPATLPAAERATQANAILRCLIGVLLRAQAASHTAPNASRPRKRVSPRIFADSLFLWSDSDPSVRFTYTHALLTFIDTELLPITSEADPHLTVHQRQDGIKFFSDALSVAAYRLALGHFSSRKPSSKSSRSSQAGSRTASDEPTASEIGPTVDDVSALQTVLLACLRSGLPAVTVSLVPMFSALLSAGKNIDPELAATSRELVNNGLKATSATWSDASSTSSEPSQPSRIPDLRSLEEGPSGAALSQLELVNGAPSDLELPSIEDLSRSTKLQGALKLEAPSLLTSLKEPWTPQKAAQHNMGTRIKGLPQAINSHHASNAHLRSASQASVVKNNTSVSDLRASLSLHPTNGSPTATSEDGSPVKRRSNMRGPTPEQMTFLKMVPSKTSTAGSSPPPATATVSNGSALDSPHKSSPLSPSFDASRGNA